MRPAFRLAYDDDLIRRNPFDFEFATVIVNDSVTREAITRDQERKYLEFVKQDKHFSRYYEGIFILFNTGLRISEFVGLTTKNIDFKHHKIIVDHQLIRSSKMQYMIEEPKTESGVREIPMSEEVEAAFRAILAKRVKPKVEPVIDGYSGFLYLDKNNMPMVALHWEKYFQHILQKYNSIYKVQMPKVTPHVCRHTFCSKMAKSGMNPKSLQYIMGHSDISVTLNTYTHVKFEDAEAEMKRVAASFTADDVEKQEAQTIIHLTAYDYELFNESDIENLKEGDVLVIDQKEMKVESVVPQSDTWVQINGGLEEDGCDLCKGEDGLYYEMLLESKSYQPMADLTLPLAKDFFFRDSADPEKQEQEYTKEEFLASLQDDVYGFNPNNTTVTVVDGEIAQITRTFMP